MLLILAALPVITAIASDKYFDGNGTAACFGLTSGS